MAAGSISSQTRWPTSNRTFGPVETRSGFAAEIGSAQDDWRSVIAAAVQQGKQGRQEDTEAGTTQQAADYEQDKRFTGHEDYTDEHARVLSALTDAQQAHDGEAVYLDEVARCSGLPREMTRALLHDLAAVHRLVTILQGTDNPDLGPRFEVKPRL